MNLVLSGPIDDSLRNAVIDAARPRAVVPIHARAIRLVDVDTSEARSAAVAGLCADARVDHAFVESDTLFASFRLLAMDMDSTLITIECIDEIADFAGKKTEVAAITEAAMRGEIADFAESLRRRVALLAGLDADVLRAVFDERLRLTSGAEELIAAAKRNGAHTLLVSGGFTYFTERLAASLSLDAAYANRLEIVDGKLTGRVIAPIFGAAEKATIVRQTLDKLGLNPTQVLVIGDGSNDIPMMQLVEHSVAFHGKAAVVKAAKHAIRYGGLATVIDYFT